MENWKRQMYLAHHGILGMKWGVRRYQNADGTYTEAGKARLRKAGIQTGSDGKVSGEETKAKAKTTINDAVINDYRNVSNGFGTANKIIDKAKNISDRSVSAEKQKESAKLDLSSMSNAELQAAITRFNLERNYKSILTEQSQNVRGKQRVSDILTTAGDVLAIGVSASTLALTVRRLMKG